MLVLSRPFHSVSSLHEVGFCSLDSLARLYSIVYLQYRKDSMQIQIQSKTTWSKKISRNYIGIHYLINIVKMIIEKELR